MDDFEKKLIEVEQRGKSNTHRLDKLEENTAVIQRLATSVELLAQNMERMAAEQEKQGERLDLLEKAPAKEWTGIKQTVLTAIVSTLSGGIIGALLALIIQ